MARTKTRYGVYYRSNGNWTGPYEGLSFTKYTINRNPIKEEIQNIKNNVLKSRIQIRPVSA